MAEFDPKGDYMQGGYWRTHTPEDNCAYTRLAKRTSPGMIRMIMQMCAEREPTKLAINAMNNLLRLPSRELVRSLRDGDAFVGADYPLGTIVKFEEEHLFLGYRAKTTHCTSNPWYHRYNYWGVVAQVDYPEPNRTVLMQIMDGFVHFERGWVEVSKFLTHDPTLEVGKVIHSRMAENDDWTTAESFRRVNSVYIWAIGKGVRKPVREMSVRGLLGRLVPNTGQ